MDTEASPHSFPEVHNHRQRAVLLAYGTSGQVAAACSTAGVDRTTHYYWMNHDPVYVAAFAEAKEQVADVLEAEATRRALGWEETQYRPDGTPYTVRRYSDTLLIFLLKGARPEKYKDSAQTQVNVDRPMEVTIRRE
jgi:hypothetical protein